MVENCLDGIDNNGDGLVDCADPQCQAGFQCVDDSPPNWKGPFYVTQTALPSGPAPLCGPTLNPFTEFAVPAGPAQCTACSCSALQGAACSAPGITCWPGSTNCNGGAGQNWTPALMDGACHKPSNLLGFNFSLSCQISSLPALVSAGTCAPSAVDFPNKALWQQRIDACGASKLGGGCGPNKACVPKGSGGPTESVCVRADGMNACPAGWSKTINAYTDAIDTRACGACTCGVPMAKCSDASYTFYDFDQCMVGAGSSNPIPVNSNACTDVSGQLDQGSWSVNGQLSKPIGSCPPSGGAPTGSVQPQKPVTYCCK